MWAAHHAAARRHLRRTRWPGRYPALTTRQGGAPRDGGTPHLSGEHLLFALHLLHLKLLEQADSFLPLPVREASRVGAICRQTGVTSSSVTGRHIIERQPTSGHGRPGRGGMSTRSQRASVTRRSAGRSAGGRSDGAGPAALESDQ